MTEAISEPSRVELPVVLDCIGLEDGRTRFRFAFEGRPYDLASPLHAITELCAWLPDYAAKTPRCACCEKLILPGQPVTVGHIEEGDSGVSHFSGRCNDTAAGFAGSYDSNGELSMASDRQ